MGQRLLRLALLFAGNAIGLIIAALVLSDVSLDLVSFIIAVVIFTIAVAIVRPLIGKVTRENAPALEGAGALVTTFIALVITDLVSDGLAISGIGTWILATVIVWLGTMIAGWALPAFFLDEETSAKKK
ncbi:MAG: phage holin family protein [Ilumatobacteraceae bacterium]|nr:phage holin family protein [Ilumatobacteraceae bacterium]